MSRAAIFIRNGVHPRRIVELYMDDEGSGEPVIDKGRRSPGLIDTRPPPGGRSFREASLTLSNGSRFPIWFAHVASGPESALRCNLRHTDHKVALQEMACNAAKLLASRFPALKLQPTQAIVMPGQGGQAEHFAQEIAKAAGLPLRTGVFEKLGAIKGTFLAQKMEWARRSYRLLDSAGIEGQSILLADDNAGSGAGMAACAELLYGRGAACVLGVAAYRVGG